jgi:hypothetical protein
MLTAITKASGRIAVVGVRGDTTGIDCRIAIKRK